MKILTVLLVAVLLAGCATIRHPSTPLMTYASVEQCKDANRNEAPELCGTTEGGQPAADTALVVAKTALTILQILTFR